MQVKFSVLFLASILIAVLLASALGSFTRVSDSALADNTLSLSNGASVGAGSSRPAVAGKNYLPIIFLNSATAGGAWLLAGNAGTNWMTDFLGTTDNMTLTLRVSNTIAYRIVPAVDSTYGWAPNIIGGSGVNSVAPGLHGATIAGGGTISNENSINGIGNYASIGGGYGNTAGGAWVAIGGGRFNTANGNVTAIGGGTDNTASDDFAAIGGGQFNIASGYAATVGGGESNTAGGFASFIGSGEFNSASNSGATVGGGHFNKASGHAASVGGGVSNTASGYTSLIGGGAGNIASGNSATVGGGGNNNASGDYSVVVGGFANTATGNYSLAAGHHAQALHAGTFVWGDATPGTISSTASNQFLIPANGGVGIGTNSPTTALHVAAPEARLRLQSTLDSVWTVTEFTTPSRTWHAGVGGATVVNDLKNKYYIYDETAGQIRQVIDTAGNVGIGTTAPAYKLDVNGQVHASGGFNGQCLSSGAFNTSGVNGCNMDVAEGFAATQLTEPGDLVALVTTATGTPTVRKATGAPGEVLVGVVSENPGLVFDNGQTHLSGDNSKLITADRTVVALVGRVNVKVSVENGAVHIGDALTSSSTPGVAIKATEAGKIIGYAMEEANADGTVLALVQPGYYAPAWEQVGEPPSSTAQIDALRREMWMMGIGLLTGGLVLGAVVAWLAVRRVQRQT